MLAQGGFFAQTYLFCGVAACAALIVRPRISINPKILIAGSIICMCLVVSALCNNREFAGIVEAMRFVTVSIVFLAISGLDNMEREKAARVMLWLTGLFAFISICSYAGIIGINGMVSNGRLEGFFQYANAAGVFYALAFLSAYEAKDKRLLLKPIFLSAFMLTLSFGVFLVFGIVFAICLLDKHKRNGASFVTEVAKIIIAAVPTVCLIMANLNNLTWLAIIGLAATLVFSILWDKICNVVSSRKAVSFICLAIGIAGGAWLVSLRANEAAATFAERIVMSKDGIRAIIHNPVLGLGPGVWRTARAAWQSYSYDATIIHNSYVQMGVDGGVLAMAAILFMMIFNVVRCRKISRAAALTLALHSLVDLTLYFTAVPVFAMLQFGEQSDGKEGRITVHGLPIRIAACGMLILFFIMFLKQNSLI